MGKPISLFTTYSQSENRVTNYCGLMMKLIYEESPRKFSQLLNTLTIGQEGVIIGPEFEQQRKGKASVPDLVIRQSAFIIAFETKLTDWFYSAQVNNHLKDLAANSGTRVLFLLSNFEIDLETRFQNDIVAAKADHVTLIPISFEELVSAFEQVCTTDYLANMLEEFIEFLDTQQLLPRWKYLLDVVNCTNTMHEIEAGVYLCPDTKGSYSHKRAKFFGPYAKKAVRKLYEIDAVVSVSAGDAQPTLKWNNRDVSMEKALLERAVELVRMCRPEQSKQLTMQAFLLGDSAVTKFKKGNSGGMRSSKQYFWDIAKGRQTVHELAVFLDGKEWSAFL